MPASWIGTFDVCSVSHLSDGEAGWAIANFLAAFWAGFLCFGEFGSSLAVRRRGRLSSREISGPVLHFILVINILWLSELSFLTFAIPGR